MGRKLWTGQSEVNRNHGGLLPMDRNSSRKDHRGKSNRRSATMPTMALPAALSMEGRRALVTGAASGIGEGDRVGARATRSGGCDYRPGADGRDEG